MQSLLNATALARSLQAAAACPADGLTVIDWLIVPDDSIEVATIGLRHHLSETDRRSASTFQGSVESQPSDAQYTQIRIIVITSSATFHIDLKLRTRVTRPFWAHSNIRWRWKKQEDNERFPYLRIRKQRNSWTRVLISRNKRNVWQSDQSHHNVTVPFKLHEL